MIGGTGAASLMPSQDISRREVGTPYGEPSSPVLEWRSGDKQVFFLARHGLNNSIPPHQVNYRANIWALSETEPDGLVAINTVGAIARTAPPGHLVFPDQLIDYTWGRDHSYADGINQPLKHIDFTTPLSPFLRTRLIDCAGALGLDYSRSGTYAVTQGPRLETAAEIDRLERDGCHIVGMTAMPEAALARELELEYAICTVVVNWAAGRSLSGSAIHDDIRQYLDRGMAAVQRLLESL